MDAASDHGQSRRTQGQRTRGQPQRLRPHRPPGAHADANRNTSPLAYGNANRHPDSHSDSYPRCRGSHAGPIVNANAHENANTDADADSDARTNANDIPDSYGRASNGDRDFYAEPSAYDHPHGYSYADADAHDHPDDYSHPDACS
ncbi:MAG: hypothetical protein QF477_14850 [SAR202 cluster bacterium]|nr:hypothetical protein [SAR202 cluster bacterium]MDP6665319.1 hypothetical protein [SAR202 cluster bacterium]MDP6799036.1 hypothetical protein [SAR202 cluster bacterium]|tara:strand:- start:1951 stop:2388 length:438 start_codon:yes stop_codon:yes gene_type:complete